MFHYQLKIKDLTYQQKLLCQFKIDLDDFVINIVSTEKWCKAFVY